MCWFACALGKKGSLLVPQAVFPLYVGGWIQLHLCFPGLQLAVLLHPDPTVLRTLTPSLTVL